MFRWVLSQCALSWTWGDLDKDKINSVDLFLVDVVRTPLLVQFIKALDQYRPVERLVAELTTHRHPQTARRKTYPTEISRMSHVTESVQVALCNVLTFLTIKTGNSGWINKTTNSNLMSDINGCTHKHTHKSLAEMNTEYNHNNSCTRWPAGHRWYLPALRAGVESSLRRLAVHRSTCGHPPEHFKFHVLSEMMAALLNKMFHRTRRKASCFLSFVRWRH